ncbi:MAG: hypothetical protein ACPGJF_01440 [Sinimarinibacterium flocculans]|uniref:hypothetical protein n=1 Tax=Sinimarinibacterium flocculans TaxID=985250 RepID=UPI003C3F9132
MDERDSSTRTSKGEPVVPTPDLHAVRRPRPIRNAPSNAGGPLPMLLLAVLIASLVGIASWGVKERDRRLALTAENARLASENEQLRQALSAQQREAAKMRARLTQPPATLSRPAPRSQPPPAPRWTPKPTPRPYMRPAPTQRPAPRTSSQNAAIRSAERRCDIHGYGTVDERACRRQAWQQMRDQCAKYRSEEAFVGARQRDEHRRLMQMWCEAERMFRIIH